MLTDPHDMLVVDDAIVTAPDGTADRFVAVTLPETDTRPAADLLAALAHRDPTAAEVIAHIEAGGRVGHIEPLSQSWGGFHGWGWQLAVVAKVDPATPMVGLRLEDKEHRPC